MEFIQKILFSKISNFNSSDRNVCPDVMAQVTWKKKITTEQLQHQLFMQEEFTAGRTLSCREEFTRTARD